MPLAQGYDLKILQQLLQAEAGPSAGVAGAAKGEEAEAAAADADAEAAAG